MDPSDSNEQSAEALGFSEVLDECLACGVLAVDSRRRICAFSPEAEELTHRKASAVLGSSSESLPSPLKELVDQTFSSKASIPGRQITLATELGVTLVLHARTAVCLSETGEPSGVVVVMSDLGAVHKLGSSMQRLDRLASIGTLSASMAHEIKNALVAVSTFVQDLRQRNKDADLSGLVVRELRRIDSIVSQMLKFAGPSKPTFSRVSLHRILDQSLRLLQPQLEAKQIRLRRSFAARSDLVEGDDYQLEQAFINVLLNGIAALEPGGQLGVVTEIRAETAPPLGEEPTGPALQVNISDSGVGIPPENLAHLFEPFFTTKTQGTGLCLAITRRIILEHRGKIAVESELTKGTTFRISFPLLLRT